MAKRKKKIIIEPWIRHKSTDNYRKRKLKHINESLIGLKKKDGN